MTDADKQFVLGLYRNAVAFYRPRIEKHTGVSLGEIAVYDHGRCAPRMLHDLRQRLGFFRSFYFRRRIQQLSQYLGSTSFASRSLYYRNAIYISFSPETAHEDMLAEYVVHELSHALWEKLEGRPMDEKWFGLHCLAPVDLERFTLLAEGYAMYAQIWWFRDLYPACVRDNLSETRMNHHSIYTQGFHVIRDLVHRAGPRVLLEIPARWNAPDTTNI